jgi:hypothetical protein
MTKCYDIKTGLEIYLIIDYFMKQREEKTIKQEDKEKLERILKTTYQEVD